MKVFLLHIILCICLVRVWNCVSVMLYIDLLILLHTLFQWHRFDFKFGGDGDFNI